MPPGDIRQTTQHELIHILGGHDCGDQSNGDCIMGDRQDDDYVINYMILCKSCIDTIKALKFMFYLH